MFSVVGDQVWEEERKLFNRNGQLELVLCFSVTNQQEADPTCWLAMLSRL